MEHIDYEGNIRIIPDEDADHRREVRRQVFLCHQAHLAVRAALSSPEVLNNPEAQIDIMHPREVALRTMTEAALLRHAMHGFPRLVSFTAKIHETSRRPATSYHVLDARLLTRYDGFYPLPTTVWLRVWGDFVAGIYTPHPPKAIGPALVYRRFSISQLADEQNAYGLYDDIADALFGIVER